MAIESLFAPQELLTKLMSMWDQLFMHMRQPIAQILLTRNDIADRTQYLNAQNTFAELLNMGAIPIVNENDTLSVQEIKFGDNDTLSAITAGMVQADYLFLMTDVDCLYDKNPRSNPDAKAIEVVEDIAELAADTSSAGSNLGTGGMGTKIVAARLATAAGVTTVITRSSKPGNIAAIVRHAETQKSATRSLEASGELPPKQSPEPQLHKTAVLNGNSVPHLSEPGNPPLHTRFLPDPHPIRDRYFWLLHGLAPHGTVYIDEGAHSALTNKAGLLPVGIVDVAGSFARRSRGGRESHSQLLSCRDQADRRLQKSHLPYISAGAWLSFIPKHLSNSDLPASRQRLTRLLVHD
ncbi:glutamate 5-kinase [Hortaea werneckii]|nr:glutamate 5-kinase [Hortaea werneckii]